MHTEHVDRIPVPQHPHIANGPSTAPNGEQIRDLQDRVEMLRVAAGEAQETAQLQGSDIKELYERTARIAGTLKDWVEANLEHNDWVEGAIKDLYDRLVFKPSRRERFQQWLKR